MSKQTRYLLTVDSATGAAVKLERLGEAGDLTEVPLSSLSVPAAPPPAAQAPQALTINIFMGGPQQTAPLSISMPATVGPGGPAPSLSTVGPGGPAPSLGIVGPGSPLQSMSAVGPGGPAPSLSTVGPGGPAPTLAGPGGPGGPAAPPPEGPAGPGGPAGGGGGKTPGGGEGGSR